MATRKLARHVTVGSVTYGPGDDVPADVAAKITNPKAWVSVDDEAPAEDTGGGRPGTTGGARLAGTVTVGSRAYGPQDFIPDDVAAQIRNPKAWEGGKVPGGAHTAAPAGPDPDPDPVPDGGDDPDGDEPSPKGPRGGKGATPRR